jgi:hypothetical protein
MRYDPDLLTYRVVSHSHFSARANQMVQVPAVPPIIFSRLEFPRIGLKSPGRLAITDEITAPTGGI